MYKRLIYIFLLLTVVMASCTKENMEDCFSGVRLRFRFTLHEEPEKGNLFGENVRHIKVYVFDQSGLLLQIVSEKGAILRNNYTMSINLKPGRYSLVAWASDNDELLRTYSQLHALDMSQNPPLYKEMEIGVSRMEDLRLILDTEEANEYPEDIKPQVDNFDDLYFGAAGTRSNDGLSQYTIVPIEVAMSQIVEREIELIRNTNIVRITIEGLENITEVLNSPIGAIAVPENPLDIWMTGKNTQYQYNNIIDPQSLCARYFPQYTFQTQTAQGDVKIERLEWAKQSEDQMKLHVKLKNGTVLYTGDLLAILKEAKDSSGNYIYKNQEDLDRIYIHPIRFVIGIDETSQDLYVKIFIHNWELITLTPEV